MKAPSSSSHWICRSCRASPRRISRAALEHFSFRLTRNSSTATTTATGAPPRKRGHLPDHPARTRFAPSPTGKLHLGSLRTALFNYLLAKATKGQFLLRIEDTDLKRTVPGAEEKIYEDLRWAGLYWDEGPKVNGPHRPYRQSMRLPYYLYQMDRLLASGRAYRCFCTSERIDELNRRRHEKGLPLGYDRKCTHMSQAEADERFTALEPNVIRFRAPDVWPKYHDLVFGKTGHGVNKAKKLQVDEPVYEDPILIKSDGFPTYHWANVCDDYEMRITHVVRGAEWMSSTPLHIALYQSMNWTPPTYAHVPLLVDQNGQKLSKRALDTDLSRFREAGIPPEVLLNFAALLGWSHQEKKDVMDLQRLIEVFDMKITKGNTVVTFDKLRYLREQHARRHIELGDDTFEQMITDLSVVLFDRYGDQRIMNFIGKKPMRGVVANMLRLGSYTYKTASDYANVMSIFLDDAPESSELVPSAADHLQVAHYLRVAASTLALVPDEQWTEPVHRANLMALETPPDETISASEWKKQLYHYLRWALIKQERGPAVSKILDLIPRDICISRIQAANATLHDLETRNAQPLEEQSWKGDADGKRRFEKEYKWTGHAMPDSKAQEQKRQEK